MAEFRGICADMALKSVHADPLPAAAVSLEAASGATPDGVHPKHLGLSAALAEHRLVAARLGVRGGEPSLAPLGRRTRRRWRHVRLRHGGNYRARATRDSRAAQKLHHVNSFDEFAPFCVDCSWRSRDGRLSSAEKYRGYPFRGSWHPFLRYCGEGGRVSEQPPVIAGGMFGAVAWTPAGYLILDKARPYAPRPSQ